MMMEVPMETKTLFDKYSIAVTIVSTALIALPTPSQAGDAAPPAHEANPGVYKVLAENDELRVVLTTLTPGQKDNSHSHPMTAVYTLKDCQARISTPDGKTRDINVKAGSARINPPVASHTKQNIGQSECQQVLVERKK
jgi:hypothetical protein